MYTLCVLHTRTYVYTPVRTYTHLCGRRTHAHKMLWYNVLLFVLLSTEPTVNGFYFY